MMCVALSLTPALSRWERENCSQRLEQFIGDFRSVVSEFYESIQRLFPLPAGEGQGEGERFEKLNN